MHLKLCKILCLCSLALLTACASAPKAPPIETCIFDSHTASLDCTTDKRKKIIRTFTEGNNYVCFPPYEFKMWVEACKK